MDDSRKCSHVMPDGDPCRAVSLKNSTLCYFHSRQKARNQHLRHALVRRTMLFGAAGRGPAIAVGLANVPGTRDTFDELSANMFDQMDLPALDSPVAVQLLVTQVTHALLLNMIHPRIAGRALYACQIATSNLANMRYFAPSSKVTVDPSPIPDVPGFEELYASVHGNLEKYRKQRNQMAAQEEHEAMLQKPEYKHLRDFEAATSRPDAPPPPEEGTEEYRQMEARLQARTRKAKEALDARLAREQAKLDAEERADGKVSSNGKAKKPPTPVGPINAEADKSSTKPRHPERADFSPRSEGPALPQGNNQSLLARQKTGRFAESPHLQRSGQAGPSSLAGAPSSG